MLSFSLSACVVEGELEMKESLAKVWNGDDV